VTQLAQSYRKRITIAGYPNVDEVTIGGVGASGDRRHPPVNGIETVRLIQEIRWRLGRTADPAQFGDPMGGYP
jgi:hypothetical protein